MCEAAKQLRRKLASVEGGIGKERIEDRDMFHSFHVLHHRCEGIQLLVNFTNWYINSAISSTADHWTLSCAVFFFLEDQTKSCFLRTKETYMYDFVRLSVELKLHTVGIRRISADFEVHV